MPERIDQLRKDYQLFTLREEDANPDPIRQFHDWFEQASLAEIPEVNAMALATATPDGRPSVRTVLLRGIDERGFTFFTNYESRKGHELAANPYASLLFFWQGLERQVRIEGRVERTSAEESDTYFFGRPAGSRIGAVGISPEPGHPRPGRPRASRPRARGPNIRTDPFPVRRAGAGTAWSPIRSNSGRAGRAACTTVSVTRGSTRPPG